MDRIPRCPRSVRHRWQFGAYPAILFALLANATAIWQTLGFGGTVLLSALLATVQLWSSWSSLYDSRGDLRVAAVGVVQVYALLREVAA